MAFGLAIDIACCADVRVCARDARFAVKEVDIGLAADIGSLSRLPRAVGSLSWAKDVCLSARVFAAPEALAAGFVSRVLPDKAAAVADALALAAALAAKSPVAVQGTKELLNHGRDHPVAESKSPLPCLPCLPSPLSPRLLLTAVQVFATLASGTPPLCSPVTWRRP